MKTTRMTLPLAFVLTFLSPFVALAQEKSEPRVSLILSDVRIQPIHGFPQRQLFRCKATLDNRTNQEVTVRSNFTVFDGLELVVTNMAGRVLVQQRYLCRQPPRASQPPEIALKEGKTSRELTFPVASAELPEGSIKVRLTGALPGSSYKRALSTDTITVERRDSRNRRLPAHKPASYALAGFIDINKDGESDIKTLRELLKKSGGTIDAKIDLEGNLKGKLTMTTRYVILGDGPTKMDSTPEAMKRFSEFMDRAKELDVGIIRVDRLLSFGSVRPDLNKNAAEQFSPRRSPKRAKVGGAYDTIPPY